MTRPISHRWITRLAVILAMLSVVGSPSQVVAVSRLPLAAPQEWADIALDDLHFIRGTLRANHPGPYDEENPWFQQRLESGFEAAQALAVKARSYAGYRFAIKRLVVGLQDGHLGALGEAGELDPRLDHSWPGFSVRYGSGGFEVAEVEGAMLELEPGDRLVGCDGTVTDRLAERSLALYSGLWEVRGARPRIAPFLLLDEGNPFVPRPKRCRFVRAGRPFEAALKWRSISVERAKAILDRARQLARPPIEIRRGQGLSWIALSSFDLGDEQTALSLQNLVSALETEPDTYRTASVLVLDLRGNTGGSSSFGNSVAAALWGPELVAVRRPRWAGVDWRVSAANLRFFRRVNLARLTKTYGSDNPNTIAYTEFVEDFSRSVERGDSFHRVEGKPAPTGFVPANPMKARVFLVTDGMCGSACLDFADVVLWLPGVVHVGRETSADAIYIDNRSERLPSGLGWLGFSMKVYRGRPRGHNESYLPAHVWDGDMRDDRALEEWIKGLAQIGG